jgi:hypothetical protein
VPIRADSPQLIQSATVHRSRPDIRVTYVSIVAGFLWGNRERVPIARTLQRRPVGAASVAMLFAFGFFGSQGQSLEHRG